MESIPTIGGFKTHDVGHVDHWPYVVKQFPQLRRYGYEHFPRGRVNWREEDGSFLLLADKRIFDHRWDRIVLTRWNLPKITTIIATDPHYKSRSIGVD